MANQAEHQAFFEALAEKATEALFSDYGVSLRRISGDVLVVSPFLIASVIGFSGANLRGTLVLAASEDPIGRTSPVPSPPSPRDWIGELANQLLGRVKHLLLQHGVEIYLNLPAVLRGEHLAPLPRVEANPIRYAAGNGEVGVWLEVEFGTKFAIPKVTPQSDLSAASGDALIF